MADSHDVRVIEEICSEFEAALSAANATVADQLLEQCRSQSADDGLLLELLKLKVEHDIRQRPLPGELITPTLRKCFVELNTDDFHDLVGHEYVVRWSVNQKMTIDDFVLAVEAGDMRLRRHLNQLASEVTPIEAALFCAGSQLLTRRMRDRLVVGRQRRGEPGHYCRIRYDDYEKMVIAARSDRRLSRQLFRIDLVAPGSVQLTNEQRGVRLILDSRQEVAPGESVIVATTSLIEFASHGLRLQFHQSPLGDRLPKPEAEFPQRDT